MKFSRDLSRYLTFSPIEEFFYGLFYVLRNPSHYHSNSFSNGFHQVFHILLQVLQLLQLVPLLGVYKWDCNSSSGLCFLRYITYPLTEGGFHNPLAIGVTLFVLALLINILLFLLAQAAKKKNQELRGAAHLLATVILALIVNGYSLDIFSFVVTQFSPLSSDGKDVVGVILGLLALLLFLPISIGYNLLQLTIDPSSKRAGEQNQGKVEVFFYFWKLISAILLLSGAIDKSSILVSVISLVLTILILSLTLTEQPFITPIDSTLRTILLGSSVGAAICAVIKAGEGWDNSQDFSSTLSLVLIVICALVALLIDKWRQRSLSNLMKLYTQALSPHYSAEKAQLLHQVLMEEISDDSPPEKKSPEEKLSLLALRASLPLPQIKQHLLFSRNAEVLSREVAKEYATLPASYQTLAHFSILSLYLSLLQDNFAEGEILLSLSQWYRYLFQDLTTTTVLLRCTFERVKTLEARYMCFCIQKTTDAAREAVAMGRKRGGKNNLADLALFRRTILAARSHHESAVRTLARAFKVMISDERQIVKNVRDLERLTGYTGDDSESASDSGGRGRRDRKEEKGEGEGEEEEKKNDEKEKRREETVDLLISKSRKNLLTKERIVQIDSAIHSLVLADQHYNTLSAKFSNNGEAISSVRLFRQHFYKDDTINFGLPDDHSVDKGERERERETETSSSFSSSLSSASNTGERDTIKRQKTVQAIQSLHQAFSWVRIGSFFSQLVIAVLMVVVTIVILTQFSFVRERIQNLSLVESMLKNWPSICDEFNRMAIITNEIIVIERPLRKSLEDVSVYMYTTPMYDDVDFDETTKQGLCQYIVNTAMNLRSTQKLYGCYFLLSTSTAANKGKYFESDNSLSSDFIAIRPYDYYGDPFLSDWYLAAVQAYDKGTMTYQTAYVHQTLAPNGRGFISKYLAIPIINSVTKNMDGVISIEMEPAAAPRQIYTQTIASIKAQDQELTVIINKVFAQVESDGNEVVLDLFLKPQLEVRQVSPLGVVNRLHIGLQEAASIFSSSIQTALLTAGSLVRDDLQNSPEFIFVQDLCTGLLFDQLSILMQGSIDYVDDYIRSSKGVVIGVAVAAFVALLAASALSIFIVRKQLSRFDVGGSLSLSTKILVELELDAKKTMYKKLKNMKFNSAFEDESEAESKALAAIDQGEKRPQTPRKSQGEEAEEEGEKEGEQPVEVDLNIDREAEEMQLEMEKPVEKRDADFTPFVRMSSETRMLASIEERGESVPQERRAEAAEKSDGSREERKTQDIYPGRRTDFSRGESPSAVDRQPSAMSINTGLSVDVPPRKSKEGKERKEKKRKSKSNRRSSHKRHSSPDDELYRSDDSHSPVEKEDKKGDDKREERKSRMASNPFVQGVKRTFNATLGKISRWFVISCALIGITLLTTSFISVNRLQDMTVYEEQIKQLTEAAIQFAGSMSRVYDVVVDDFIPQSEKSSDQLRQEFLHRFQEGVTILDPLFSDLQGGRQVLRSVKERELFTFQDHCMDITGVCDSTTVNGEILKLGFYKVYLWLKMHYSWLYEEFAAIPVKDVDTLSLFSQQPASLWKFIYTYRAFDNGIRWLRDSFMMEANDFTDSSRNLQLVFCFVGVGLILVSWVIIETVMRLERGKLKDLEMVLKILPWRTLCEKRIFVKYFDAKEDLMNDGDDEEEEDEKGKDGKDKKGIVTPLGGDSPASPDTHLNEQMILDFLSKMPGQMSPELSPSPNHSKFFGANEKKRSSKSKKNRG